MSRAVPSAVMVLLSAQHSPCSPLTATTQPLAVVRVRAVSPHICFRGIPLSSSPIFAALVIVAMLVAGIASLAKDGHKQPGEGD